MKGSFGMRQINQAAFAKPPADKSCVSLVQLLNSLCEWEMKDKASSPTLGSFSPFSLHLHFLVP